MKIVSKSHDHLAELNLTALVLYTTT